MNGYNIFKEKLLKNDEKVEGSCCHNIISLDATEL